MDGLRPRPAAAVFDALGAEYERAFAGSAGRLASLRRLLDALAPHSRVLDVGSGTGRPTASTLTGAGHDVLGVDVSPVMVELATRQVPDASFVCADIRELDLEEGKFDAVCAYFSLLQMGRDDQLRLLRKLRRLLVPGGVLAVATVPLDVEDVPVVFMGQEMRVSSFDPDGFLATVTAAGFSVLWEHSELFTPAHGAAVPEPELFLHCCPD
ncbi:class I SAM-dependent methyltransferase [Streptomyces sp. NPDC056061]|uniref:class I SAM-dependent methyltransferase n=1 Tax=Streptomyces sp. NPDC056061 TaxID=3345700 RepID=UPI0035D650B7